MDSNHSNNYERLVLIQVSLIFRVDKLQYMTFIIVSLIP